MTNLDFVRSYYNLYLQKIVKYVLGGWLQPLTPENKDYFIETYPKNRTNETIYKGIITASNSMLAGDCNCTIKSFLDKLVGVDHQSRAMRSPCPDINIEEMLNTRCVEVSEDMSNILLGEYMVYKDKSHCGIYMGKVNGRRMVAEVTYRWDNGLQMIDMDRPERKGLWGYHGKLWLDMDYSFKGDSFLLSDTEALRKMVNQKLIAKKGSSGNYVKEIQKNLIDLGYSCGSTGADGKFGSITERAVMEFQKDRSLTADGVVGLDTINAILNVDK